MLIGVVEKPALADITKIHYVVSLNETIDAFTTTIMQRRHWSTNLECNLHLANIYQQPKTGKEPQRQLAWLMTEYREGLKCTFQKQGVRLRLLSTFQAPRECAVLDI